MTVPAEAITAAYDAVGYTVDIPGPAVIKRILEAAAPLIAAAERERVLGYQVAGKLYHPGDVRIVYRDAS